VKVTVNAMCSGSQTKKSQKGNNYTLTNFVDVDTMRTFSVFGDLGLPADKTPREYVLDGVTVQNFNAESVFGSAKAPAPARAS